MNTAWALLQTTATRWNDHNAPRMGAALAYYTVLSMAPLLVVVVAIAGLVFGDMAARGEIVNEVASLVGTDIARIIQDLLQNAHHPTGGLVATTAGVFTLLLGASAVFAELRDSLNQIWGVSANNSSGWKAIVLMRLTAFAVVLTVGFLLLISLVVSAALEFLTKYLNSHVSVPGVVAHLVEPLVSVAIVMALFALVYKYIPDVPVQWKEVWIGAAFTAVLFTAGKFALAVYLGKASIGSAYGAAGSMVVLLVWVYYSSQIFFFGAEFTKVYADWRVEALKKSAT